MLGCVFAAGSFAAAPAANAPQGTPVKLAELNEVGDEVPIGKNRTKEACRFRLVQERDAKAAGGANRFQRYGLYCEGWTQPSAELRRFRSTKDLPPSRLGPSRHCQSAFHPLRHRRIAPGASSTTDGRILARESGATRVRAGSFRGP